MYISIVRKMTEKMLNPMFGPAKRNSAGDLKLVRLGMFRWLVSLGFLCAVSALLLMPSMEMDAEESGQFIAIIGACAFLLGFLAIFLLLSKTIVTDHEVRSHSWFASKTISFSDIEKVGFSRFFGGRFILQGTSQAVKVPLMSVGSAEFVDKLSEKLGKERAGAAVEALAKQKQQIERL
ncbi:hypothetical protein [Paenibacillus chitinolyticus]|uniref:hypothetical protein n=1 Tax=Paenibacillus chitinolyticus TaxID=79263 RepID=UPI00365730F6